ncbi:GNAT family N-acetyltransferase [Paenibacillus silvae]|uniref:GNAT family N-acetyltransferase n=1 Tax=Paenibacillus silvae TaxID=1325358 RepID=UPI0011A792BE|nr:MULTISPECIES: GNAT family N-acetyltransferase [Paenibacillus]MCK6073849.1 GNAT family N-acetyltransferase [Paenibacillus silvae]MCK6148675.1 GNAT family N-acetyltransferase [Paenibacillus silvae]MCK6266975.1 GNAT family N-acetyltransferase [Paenibacillus silvae]
METERLVFRDYTKNDFEHLYTMTREPNVMKYIRHGGPWTKEETLQTLEKFVQWNKAGKGLLLAFNKEDNQLVGTSGLIPQVIEGKEELEVGYWVREQYWGQGYGYEQANAWKEQGLKLGHKRLISLIQHGNTGSMRIAQKNGMIHEKDVDIIGKQVAVFSVEV